MKEQGHVTSGDSALTMVGRREQRVQRPCDGNVLSVSRNSTEAGVACRLP